MRGPVPSALLLSLAACATPAAQWEKAGVSAQATASDIVDCRQGATRQGFMFYPWGAPPDWFYRRSNWVYWSDIQDGQRVTAEKQLTALCMHNKGYELVSIPRTQG